MADRRTLHISKLESFKEWLEKDGWTIEEPKGVWEALRARKLGRPHPLIAYLKLDAKEHLSIMDRDVGVVKAFLRDEKKPKTNADRIRLMSDEELADWLTRITNDAQIDTKTKCDYQWLDWLHSEVEET